MYWNVSVGLKFVLISRTDSLLNLWPLYMVVSKKVTSVHDISAVNLIVGWCLFACSMNLSTTGFVKGEALRLLRTNSLNKIFEENITKFKKYLMERGYPQSFIKNTPSEVKLQERTQALLQRNKTKKRILPFVTQYHPAVPNLKEILTRKWYLIQQQPLLNQILKEPPIIPYGKGRSLNDIFVRAKL